MQPTNRAVVVTGAASGIGRAIAEAFIAAGDRVAVVDVDPAAAEATAAALGEHASWHACDVADTRHVNELGRRLDDDDGVDVLCNNAGIFDHFTSATEMDDALWNSVLAVNLTGTFLLSRAVLPSMIARGGGAIVNTASICGLVGGSGGVAYTASKHGVVGLTRQLAHEFGPHGVRVNAICPGVIATGMSMPLLEDPERSAHTSELARNVPSRRFGAPEEVGRLAVFLAGDDAGFIQGAAIPIDGGYTAV
jgi:3-oxoacyl-[acyl-carrier protein] reductase